MTPDPFLQDDPQDRSRPAARVAGYTHRVSYAPGEPIVLHASANTGKVDVDIIREGPKPEVVKSLAGLAVGDHPAPPDASSHGCRWPQTAEFAADPAWKSGYYTVRLKGPDADGKELASNAYFVLRPGSPGKNTRILLQLSTNTYNAYNNWGGYSLYSYNGKHLVQGRRVSFLRPPSSQFPTWEQPFVQWAESNGYTLDYAANLDLEQHPELLDSYKLVLSVGHDEYWSAPMRDHLEAFIGRGGNVAFFSGNSVCWQVRSEDDGSALTCWKQAFRSDPQYRTGDYRTLSSLWSHYLVNRPENQLTGVGFLHGGYHRSHGQFMDGPGSFIVHRPDHWLFEGTSLKQGDTFGGKDTIVGYECDGCELEWKDGLPSPTHRDGTPDSFVVLGTREARWHPDDCEWYERWTKGHSGHAVLGTYTRNGTVVTAGSTDWSHGLRGADPATMRITKNVLDRLGT